MVRIILSTVALWTLLLSPGLCLAGVIEHFCADAPPGDSCEHEEECEDDPCGAVLLRPETAGNISPPAPFDVLPPSLIPPELDVFALRATLQPSLATARENRPHDESDIPLLI